MISRHRRGRIRERGVALLVAMFALLLLSAVGMGMMFSANTETNINANYREKQVATYASLAGVQEAKARLQGVVGDVGVPTGTWMPASAIHGLPSLSATNVVYVINPASGETVAPWRYDDQYADTELCHENVLGLTPPLNLSKPCSGSSSLPSSTGWRQVVNNSSVAGPFSSSGSTPLNPPLPYKWVRVQLKANNSTPYPVDGDVYPDSSHGGQVCWNGVSQIPLPSGYKADCTPNGAVTSIVVTNGGNNYSTAPSVTIAAPGAGGTQAQATAHVANPSGQISGIIIDNGGSGYTTPPVVQVTGGGGSGAAGTANIVAAGAAVTSLTHNGNGTGCWAGVNPTSINLSFSGGGGMGGGGTATTTSGYDCIASMKFTSGSCSTNRKDPATVTADGGSNFAGNFTIPANGNLTNEAINVTNPGTGYTSGTPTVGLSSGGGTPTCTNVQVVATLGHTYNGNENLAAGGAGYTTSPTVVFTPLPTTGALPSVTANLGPVQSGQVISVTMTSGGSGYTSPPTVTFVGGCGPGTPPPACPTTATAHATFPGIVDRIDIVDGGSGYLGPPLVTIAGGGGTGAAAKAWVQGGTYYSPIYLLTALGVSPAGARSMIQMEAAPAIRSLSLPGALTLAGPQPNFGAPNSYNFSISGTDHPNGYIDPTHGATAPLPAGCPAGTAAPHPSIGVYDNPDSPTSPTSVATVLGDIPTERAPTNYPGLSASPDVRNVYGALGDQGTTPSGMESIVSAVSALAGPSGTYTGNQSDSTINMGSCNASNFNPAVDVVYGNVNFNGSTTGCGILVVTGTLNFAGNTTWNGIVLAIGQGVITFSGGGGGTINGSVFVAKTRDTSGNLLSELGTPTLDWSGGGGNGIYYDHCYADGLLSMIPTSMPVSTTPLTILSVKTLTY